MSNDPGKEENPGFSQLRMTMYQDAVRTNGILQIALFLGYHAVIVYVCAACLPGARTVPAVFEILAVVAVLGSLLHAFWQMKSEEGRIHGYYMNDEKFMPAALAVLPAGLAGLLLLAAMVTEVILRLRG